MLAVSWLVGRPLGVRPYMPPSVSLPATSLYPRASVVSLGLARWGQAWPPGAKIVAPPWADAAAVVEVVRLPPWGAGSRRAEFSLCDVAAELVSVVLPIEVVGLGTLAIPGLAEVPVLWHCGPVASEWAENLSPIRLLTGSDYAVGLAVTPVVVVEVPEEAAEEVVAGVQGALEGKAPWLEVRDLATPPVLLLLLPLGLRVLVALGPPQGLAVPVAAADSRNFAG